MVALALFLAARFNALNEAADLHRPINSNLWRQ